MASIIHISTHRYAPPLLLIPLLMHCLQYNLMESTRFATSAVHAVVADGTQLQCRN